MATATKKSTGNSADPSSAAAVAPDEQWLVTFSGETGQIARIERLEPNGQRTELSEEEYAALSGHDLSGMSDFSDPYGYGMYGADPYSGYGQEGYDASGSDPSAYAYGYGGDPYGLEEAYYQGVADSQAMMGMGDPAAMSGMSGEYELSPEEQAYYQGMQDYMTASGM